MGIEREEYHPRMCEVHNRHFLRAVTSLSTAPLRITFAILRHA
jgi:hypothetical protein